MADKIGGHFSTYFDSFTTTFEFIIVEDKTTRNLIFGCMGLGGGFNENPVTQEDTNQAAKAIETALESGIDTFDHADIYAFGKAESVFGNVLKDNPSLRDKMKLQSKTGIKIGHGPNGSSTYDLSKEYILAQVKGILKRLNTDYLDTFLLHRPDALMEVDEIAAAFQQLKQDGLVHDFGVSNMSVHQMVLLDLCLDEPLVTNQIQLSLGHSVLLDLGVTVNTAVAPRSSGLEGMLEYAQMNHMSLQTWGSLDGGLFTGKPVEDPNSTVGKTASLISELAEKHSTNVNAIALAWLFKIPGTIEPVIGTTNTERIKQCGEATRIELTREEWYNLWITARGNGLP